MNPMYTAQIDHSLTLFSSRESSFINFFIFRGRSVVTFLHLSIFCSARSVERQCSYFATIQLRHVPAKVTSALVLFVICEGLCQFIGI